jgi:hypothetical protein
MSAFSEKTFFVGVGAAKAGTTWLYRYLRQHPDVFTPAIKELHYWDDRFRPDASKEILLARGYTLWREKFAAELGKLESKSALDSDPRLTLRIGALRDRLAMSSDDAYRAYWRDRVGPRQKAFGEITPAYALLPLNAFQKLRDQHATVRVIYLLRDPVDRLFSHMKVPDVRYPGLSAVESFEMALARRDSRVERSRYDLTLERLDRVFASDELLVEFYESMFTEEATRRICSFLGIRWRQANFFRRINQSSVDEPLPEHLRASARELLQDVYRYCRTRFGERLPWS